MHFRKDSLLKKEKNKSWLKYYHCRYYYSLSLFIILSFIYSSKLSDLKESFYVCCCFCCWVTSVASDSVWSHRRQPTSLCCAWDSPGKNTGWVAISFSNAWKWKVKVKSLSPTLSDPMDCSLPGSSVHRIFPDKSTGVGCHCLLCLLCLGSP